MGDMIGIRADLVARYKREVQNKTYRIKSNEIAQKMTQALQEDEKFVLSHTPKKNRWSI